MAFTYRQNFFRQPSHFYNSLKAASALHFSSLTVAGRPLELV
ncbi:hypothetical protein FLA_6026 [Filimonas lacunae]|nr:hypothetical protein FLA_6026 [Filimonas lacunae]